MAAAHFTLDGALFCFNIQHAQTHVPTQVQALYLITCQRQIRGQCVERSQSQGFPKRLDGVSLGFADQRGRSRVSRQTYLYCGICHHRRSNRYQYVPRAWTRCMRANADRLSLSPDLVQIDPERPLHTHQMDPQREVLRGRGTRCVRVQSSEMLGDTIGL